MQPERRDDNLTSAGLPAFAVPMESGPQFPEPPPNPRPNEQDEFWLQRGIRPPQNRPGGPPVEEHLFEPFFDLCLPRDEAARVFWLISEYRDWNRAYGQYLRELKTRLEQSQ